MAWHGAWRAYAPRLLIAVDCGTSSVAEIADLHAQGVDVIVLDHHECKAALPECVALVNPKLGDDFHYLCSVGIVFKVAHALLKTRPRARGRSSRVSGSGGARDGGRSRAAEERKPHS